MKTKFVNELFVKLNNGCNNVTVDLLDNQTIISVKRNNAEVYAAVSEDVLEICYTPDGVQDFKEILFSRLDLADVEIISHKMLRQLNTLIRIK